MLEDNNSKQTQLGNMDDALDTMMFGYDTPTKIRLNNALEKRKFRRGKKGNQAK